MSGGSLHGGLSASTIANLDDDTNVTYVEDSRGPHRMDKNIPGESRSSGRKAKW